MKWILRAVCIAALRKAWSRCPAKIHVMQAAKAILPAHKNADGSPSKSKRVAYSCASCGELFQKRDVHVDHVVPVVDVTAGYLDLESYARRLFVVETWSGTAEDKQQAEDALQVLCKGCHKNKTAGENKKRKKK